MAIENSKRGSPIQYVRWYAILVAYVSAGAHLYIGVGRKKGGGDLRKL